MESENVLRHSIADKFYHWLISRSVLSGLFTHWCAHHQLKDESAPTNIKSQHHQTDGSAIVGHSKVGEDDILGYLPLQLEVLRVDRCIYLGNK